MTLSSRFLHSAQSGKFLPISRILSLVGGALIAIFTNKQLMPLKMRLFLGFCYNSLKQ